MHKGTEMPGLIGLPCKSPWLSWELRAGIAGAEHASPKTPCQQAEPRGTSGEWARMEGQDRWAGIGALSHQRGFWFGDWTPDSSNLHTQQFRAQ